MTEESNQQMLIDQVDEDEFIGEYLKAGTPSIERLCKEWGKEINNEIPFFPCDDETIIAKIQDFNEKYGPLIKSKELKLSEH